MFQSSGFVKVPEHCLCGASPVRVAVSHPGGMEETPATTSIHDLGHGYSAVPAALRDGQLGTRCPCHGRSVHVPLDELERLGEVAVRCPATGMLADLRYDPWSAGGRSRALWIAQA